MVSSGLVSSVVLVRTDVSEELGAPLQEPHGVTTQKTPFFIVTAVKTSNLTFRRLFKSPSAGSMLHSVLKTKTK
jgi:hypothetical protein